eukprot:TRINITY_DN105_c0_g1_i1.p1 TRINITY_DN105_c0_g1~~TRINITY_DN105_c0_g1_i1.p1  ORF type:complete len:211 (-),score=30.55 TRINITY_DN105_c0_g1_i1:32-664(-)
MLIPKKDRKLVYDYLFNEGVLCAKKDFNAPKHHVIPVNNLYVIKLLQSLKSKGFVTEKFSWMWFYWYLTNEGIEYLREYLNLPPEIVPATLRKQKTASRPPTAYGDRREGGDRGERGGFRGGRGRGFGGDRGYSGDRSEGGDKKFGGAPGEFNPSYRGEGGRGRGGYGGEGGRGRGFGGDRGGEGGYRRAYNNEGGAPSGGRGRGFQREQ